MAFEQLHTRVCNTSVARLSFTILIVTQQQSREINLYDADGNLVDRLTYGDNTLSGSIRVQNNSGNPESLDVLGMMRWAGSPLLLAMSTALTWRPIVVVEERPRDAYVLTYTAAACRTQSLASASLGSTVDNVGLEGVLGLGGLARRRNSTRK